MKTKYVLITPVHNEEKFIEKVIKSVIVQTVLPQRWLIVDDGSTDGTSEIIKQYEDKHAFITCLRVKHENTKISYEHRINIFLRGYEEIKNIKYDFIGSLDADITFDRTYYENILVEFERNPKLGIASGIFIEIVKNQLQKVLRDPDLINTPGGLLMFRRECYEAIGGYYPLKHGGADTLAGIVARMNGWQTKAFPQYEAVHHRPVGTAGGKHILVARFGQGLTDYGLSAHPLFMLAKLLRRAYLEKPYFIGTLARLAGFMYGYWLSEKREIPPEVVRFVRKEQIRRLFSYITNSNRA